MKAKETLLGRHIMVRQGSKRKPHYKLTEPMLRRYCPELFMTTPDELATEVRAHLSALDGRVRALVDERTAPEFEELRVGQARMMGDVGRLAKHTDDIERRVARLEKPRKPA